MLIHNFLKKDNIDVFRYTYILIYVLLVAFLNIGISKYVSVIYLFISLSLLIYSNIFVDRKMPKYNIILLLMITAFLLVSLFFGNNGIYNCLISFAFLVSCCSEFYDKNDFNFKDEAKKKYYKKVNLIFHIILSCFFVYDLFNHFVIDHFSLKDNYCFYNIPDKNFFAVLIYLYFFFCYRTKFKIGYIFCLIFTFLIKSRLVLLSLLFLLFLNILKKLLSKKINFNSINNINYKKSFSLIYMLFMFSTLFIILLSFFWINFFSNDSVKPYKQSFNDGSNAIRMRANVYAVERVGSEPELLYSGYDKKIYNKLGIEDNANGVVYRGFRLVQPHNFVLNIFLRYGILLSCLFLYILSILISKKISINNSGLLITYFFMNLFMHSLFSYPYIVFFFLILSINNRGDVNE